MTGHECCQGLDTARLVTTNTAEEAVVCGARDNDREPPGPPGAMIRWAIKPVLWIIVTRFGCGDGR